MRTVDLRSDTVTRPTPAMRDAIYAADVGDDVYGDDPTVNALEALAAEILSKEAALFVTSGTQANLVALLTHCGRGDEYIAGATAHTYWYEAGGAAVLGGIQPQTLPFEPDGTLDLTAVAKLVKPDDVHFARTRLVCLENTQAGRATGPAYFATARQFCDDHELRLHLDGARLFNAAIATQCAAQDIAVHCDSVSICLSKGLGAPAGSLLLGTAEFIREARRWRKMLGGGLRQAGILAAAGIHALAHHVDRLADDHDRAARLADAVNERYPEAAEAHTNMVFLNLPEAEVERLKQHLAERGIVIRGPRWVTHLDITDEDVERVVAAV
ncbi:MAG: low-specificity L-threonine aldolase, partial [Pseudomonadales bacterium]|nr:low-specificity L-threonine aldolase [Pseudomonadales bacterium]NIX08352.1 low-specificity L-threonine aldolase [Pseudomonadales bacterium]